jgi:hypothetical protein
MADFLEAANFVYSQSASATPAPDLTVLTYDGIGEFSPSNELSDGFYAEAFIDTATHQVIIAFEGTNPTLATAYGSGTLAADLSLFLGGSPQVLADAVSFAQEVETVAAFNGISASNIFVTGHSLGGAEAEAVNQALGLGGVTFGAPGISTSATSANLVNYVDYGDPVGNLGTDTQAGPYYSLPGIQHVGPVVPVGNPSSSLSLETEGKIYSALTSLLSDQSGLLFKLIPYGSLTEAAALVADIGAAGVNIFENHLLPSTYIPDMGYSLNGTAVTPGANPIQTPAQVGGPSYSNGPTGSQGAADAIGSAISYSSISDSVSASGQLQRVTVDMTDGTSDVVNFDTSGGTWQEIDNIYNSWQSSGQLIESDQVNNDDSQTYTVYNVTGSVAAFASEVYQIDASGNLTSLTENFTDGNSLTFGAGTYSNIGFTAASDTLNVALTYLDTLAYNIATGTSVVTLADGLKFDISGGVDANIQSAGGSPLSVIASYLTDLGDPMTAAQINELNFNYLNPAGGAYGVTGTVQKVDDSHATVTYSVGQSGPGAVVAGQDTALITDYEQIGVDQDGNPIIGPVQVAAQAYNILDAYGDLSQDSISNVQELAVEGGVTLLNAQFTGFSAITGSGSITAADGGTFNLADANAAGNFTTLSAASWDGATLIGNNQDNQTLIASTYGNDTLEAGNGAADILRAGYGADTLIGGTGGDTFQVYSPAEGTVIEGNGGGNTLVASGDIAGATISGIQTLDNPSSLTLNAAELSGFSTIQNSGTLYAATGGTYQMPESSAAGITLAASSDAGTTLVGNNANSQTLQASGSGNDTLIAGNGEGDTLRAGGGVDTLIGGTGGDTFVAWNGLAAGSVIQGNGTGNALVTSGDLTGVAISGVQTLEIFDLNNINSRNWVALTASQLANFSSITGGVVEAATGYTIEAPEGGTYDISKISGAPNLIALSGEGTTLIGNNADGQFLQASSLGNDTLIAGNGAGDTLYAGDGVDTLIGGTGGDTFVEGGLAAGSVIQGNGSGNTLDTVGDLTRLSISGVQTLDFSDTITLNADQLAGFSAVQGSGTIDAASAGAYSLAGKSTASITLTAVSNAGTALIGDNANGEILNASASGNDTLEAGNGAGDVLIAGTGVDTIIGGTGGDTFELLGGFGNPGGLAAGSSIQGNGSGNVLDAFGDLSGVTISGVQTLDITNLGVLPGLGAGYAISLNAAAMSGFSTIIGSEGVGTIDAATGGVFDLSGKSTGNITLTALSNAGTTLIGDNAGGETLNASASGNDTLQAGSGNGDNINGGGGQDTLVAGSGQNDILIAGTGNTDMIAGSGGDWLFGGIGTGSDIFDLTAAAGHTLAYGGNGQNTAIFSKDRSAYNVTHVKASIGFETIVTDPSAGAVDTLRGIQTLQFADVTIPSYAPQDNFTGGTTSEILGWNPSTGVIGDFVMTGGVAGAFQDIAWVNPSSGYQVVGSGDFYGSGTADILLANSSGFIGQFEMSSNTATWQGIGLINSGAGWSVAGTGDFYGNGTDDILLANQSAGQIGEFEMNNGVATWQGIGTVNAAAGWAVAGTGDFFGNGTDDILLANQSAGQIGMFEMNKGVASWQGIGTVDAAAGWAVAGTGDFFGNGTDDILLANTQTGALGMFAMNNGVASWQSIGSVGAGWQVAGTGDYFGNGTSDILLQNAATGGIGMFAMNNGVASWQGIASLPAGWHVS